MSSRQYLLIITGVILLVALFLFGKTKLEDDKEINANENATPEKEMVVIPADVSNKLEALGAKMVDAEEDSLASLINRTIELCREKALPQEAAKIIADAAELRQSADLYRIAGEQYYNALVADPSKKQEFAEKAIYAFDQSLILEPHSENVRVQKAAALLDGTDQTMQGIQLLLEVVKENENNADAQFILGKFGVVSNQYDKAIIRLEKVISLQPSNAEAYFLLAEAYRGKGEVEKSIELLEKCKSMVNNPSFSKEIEQYILSIKAKQ